jgi:deoxyribonuclease V
MCALTILQHAWPETAQDAIALQKELAGKVKLHDAFKRIELIAGVDVAYDIHSNISHAVVVTMKPGSLQPLTIIRAQLPTRFPYISGLLSFREIPVLLEALGQLAEKPDLLMVDGQGVAHPRRLGIAAHLGVLTDIPSIGVAKSLLTGIYEEPDLTKGSHTPLRDRRSGEMIGTVLRSKDKFNPLFISAGHRVSQDTALKLVMKCLIKHRLPEPTRIADKLSKARPDPGGELL